MVAALPACLACRSGVTELWASAGDVEYKTVADRFSFYRCGQCEALSIHPVPVDRLQTIYPPNYYSFVPGRLTVVDRIKDRLDRARFRTLLSAVPGRELSALDVGGGNGRQLDVLRSADPRVTRTTVVDIDSGAAAAAAAAGHRFVQDTIEEARLDETFDVVLLLNLIEHVADPGAVLRKVRNLLSPGGVALIQTPNYRSWDAAIFRHRNWGGYHCPRHWVLFTRASFGRLAEETGLAVTSFRYTQGAPFWTVSVLAAFEKMGLTAVTSTRPAWMHPLYAPLAALFAAADFVRGIFRPLSQMIIVVQRR